MALPQNRQAIRDVLKLLELRVIGRPKESFRCGCGEVHLAEGIATAIRPGGDYNPGQETLWYLWTVEITPSDPKCPTWGTCLSDFVETEELETLFAKHFPTRHPNPYELPISDSERVEADLPMAVRIMDNEAETRFSVNWGRDQADARIAAQFFRTQPLKINRKDSGFDWIIQFLRTCTPHVYQGGPEPELPHEPRWPTDYIKALDALQGPEYIALSAEGMSSTLSRRAVSETGINIVFWKAKEDKKKR